MKLNDLKNSYTKLGPDDKFDERIRKNVLGNRSQYKFFFTKGIAVAAILIVVILTNITVYAFSTNYREMLADILNINSDETHYIGKQTTDNNIRMTVVSSHLVNNTAVVLVTYEKADGETFKNGMNPGMEALRIDGKKIAESGFAGGIYSELSEDRKTLYCYFTWKFNENVSGKTAKLTVTELICNQSQVEGITWEDDIIKGNWEVSFQLMENTDNSLTVINDDKEDIVSMCGKELQIQSVILADMLLIVNTTTLSDSGMPYDPLSNTYVGSGAYYGVFIRIKYNDGTMSDKIDCLLDEDDNIVAWIPKTIDKNKVKEIHVGDIVLKVPQQN